MYSTQYRKPVFGGEGGAVQVYSTENQFLQVRRSSPTPPMAMTTPGPDTDIKISLSPFTSRLPKSLEVDRRLGLHQASK